MASAKLGSIFGALILASCFSQYFCGLDWELQRLNQFQQKYNNSRSDILFLLDVSLSVSDFGFGVEKKFINSLLSEVSVQPIASRVAVITFAESVEKNIDYIDYGLADKNKCTFTKDFARVHHKKGYATNMNAAFLRAKKVLDDAKSNGYRRSNVNTVIILLTDGVWNWGGNPESIATTMRTSNEYHAEVISVGVDGAKISQLRDISGTTGNVIFAKDFTDFEQLSARIRGDQIEKLYVPVHHSICGKVCDDKAYCSCGTISGIYQCACGPGYYGSGDPGHCQPCPIGGYKTYSSPDPCKLCPAFSSTVKSGSKSVADCKCFEGYKGNPGLGIACKVVECPPFLTTIHNGKVENCGKKYKETCTFVCNQYHHMIGETSQTKKAICQKTGTWNIQRTPSCEAITCPVLPVPHRMKLVCDNNNIISSKCTFECSSGYRRNGTLSRTCRADGQWSGEQPRCTVIQCSSLKRVDNVNILPLRCIDSKTNYNDGCAYSCKAGFTPTKGNQQRRCHSDGKWSGEELVCEDKTPPTINCPADLVLDTDVDQPTKEISFKMPTVIDNSDALSQSEITLEQFPSNIKSPYKFPIGVTSIEFSAKDEAGNKDDCTFRVEVKDTQAPVFKNCPSDIEKTVSVAGATSMSISWDEVTYSDNSGKATLVSTNPSPLLVQVGIITLVKYTLTDDSSNTAECNIHIKINSAKCPAREAPINGVLPCTYIPNVGNLCKPQCMNPYTWNGRKAIYYLCKRDLTWGAIPPYFPNKWPDCTVLQTKLGMGRRVEMDYYSGNCHESISGQDKIKQNFKAFLNIYLTKGGNGNCSMADNSIICNANNVKITCGKLQTRKRSTQSHLIKIEVDIEVLSKTADDATVAGVVNDLSNAVANAQTSLSSGGDSIKAMSVDGDRLTLARVQPVGIVTGVCRGGSVIGTNVVTSGKCVSCTGGKYFDVNQRDCIDCPIGTYTEYPGSLGCSFCPHGKTTVKTGTHNVTECRAPCPPGSFSASGVANCKFCAKGTYQSEFKGKQCLRCPGSTTTQREGANKIEKCGMTCQAGTYSVTGVEPCLPCPRGYYLPTTGGDKCLACKNSLYTHGKGSVSDSQCVSIDECSSNPCMNGAVCVDEADSFRCECKPGFLGPRCQKEKNECASNPCFRNSYCIDMVNGYQCVCPLGYKGQFCEKKEDECTSSKCQNNGKCSETPDGFVCSCSAGFTGKFCERTINECASAPCLNYGTCIDSSNGFSCQCQPGFSGELCQFNKDDCEKNDLCLNDGVCDDGDDAFTCTCKPGFAGSRCEVNIDECGSNPCRNGGKCIDLVNGYKCKCAPTFIGASCQNKRKDFNFELVFNRDVQSYSESLLHNDLSAFTLSFWMKGNSDDIQSGTVVSYAVDVADSFIDNALVLQDPDSFQLTIMGQTVNTQISVNDGEWHHVAVTWSSSSGSFSTYQDGLQMNDGANFQAGKIIPSDGHFIVGQEQDEVGRNFSMGEAFYGSISQLNLWNNVLPERDIVEISRYRCPGIHGNQFAWSDFLEKNVEAKVKNSFCAVKNTKFSTWNSSSIPSNGNENEMYTCSNAVSGQCISTDKKTIKGLNIHNARCSKEGFTCEKSKNLNKDCADFQARFECPFTKSPLSCLSSPCNNGGKCLETSIGYRCECRDGYHGANCENGVSCHLLKVLAHGTVRHSGIHFFFACLSGYRLSGNSYMTCQAGSLAAPVPTCVDNNECSSSNGGCSHKCTNTVGSFKCACTRGYQLSGGKCIDRNECQQYNGNCQHLCYNTDGSYRCRCRAGFTLSKDLRSCEDMNECQSGGHQCEQACINSLGSFICACRPGYMLASDGKSCSRISCPATPNPAHGSLSAANYLYGTSVSYTCNQGYKRNGPAVRVCARNGQWTGNAPTCQAISCVPLGDIENGAKIKTGNSYGAVNKFTCNSGYLLNGAAETRCQQDGKWSNEVPRCVPYNCQPLTAPINGKIIGSSLVVGSSVLIFCNIGHMLPKGAQIYRTCLNDGSWSGSEVSCIAATCPTPTQIGNGSVTSTGTTYGKIVSYKCSQGFGLSGPGQFVCKENGKWSGVVPTCLWKRCSYPGVIANGDISGHDYSFGKKVTYSCRTGYQLIGERERMCLNSGRWTGDAPKCKEIICGNPGAPANGIKNGNEYKYGSAVSFDCNAGYSLKGSSIRKCQQDGHWDGTQPTCAAGICGSASLVGPSGSVMSPNYPTGYGLNEYCRWAITVASAKKASLTVKSLKTKKNVDRLEIRDGASGLLINVLTGLLNQPITYTSGSNKLDLKFISDGNNVAAVEGFEATYQASTCGGHIASIGESLQSPNYPSHYPNGVTCVWQIMANGPVEIKFDYFVTFDYRDKIEIWNSLTNIEASTWIGQYYGSKGSLLRVQSDTGFMYVKFSSDSYHSSSGFKGTVRKAAASIGK